MCELKILMYLLNKISGAEKYFFRQIYRKERFFESILGFDLGEIELVQCHHTNPIQLHLATFYTIQLHFYYIQLYFNSILCYLTIFYIILYIILATFYTIDLPYIILYAIIFYHIQLHLIKLCSILYTPLTSNITH